MEHNDIDKYFKDRAPQFDEQPGDALWAKIESGLDATTPKHAGRAPGKWVWILSGLVITVVAAVFIFFNYFTSEGDSWLTVPAPEVVEDVQEVPSEEIVAQSADTVKPKALAPKPAKGVKKRNNAVANLAPNPNADTINELMPGVAVATPKAAPQPRKIKVSVQESAKRTVLTVREKISQQKFDSIVAASMEQYKSKAGMQLIVKGLQNPTYRYTFPIAGEVNSLQDSSITTPKKKLAVTAKIITTKDTVTTESDEFTPRYDSVTDTYFVQYSNRVKADNDPIYTARLSVQPEFPGGIKAFQDFIYSHFRMRGIDKEIEAKIHVSFIIERDGTLSNIKALKNDPYGLGTEAVRVIKTSAKKWKPGEVNGRVVRTAYFMPLFIKSSMD